MTDLCGYDEIIDPGARGFVVADEDDLPMKVLVVRRGDLLRGYVNKCPHNRIPLDFRPDDFLDLTKRYVQCSTHGALFQISDGLCIEGPCTGKYLDPFPVRLQNGRVLAERA